VREFITLPASVEDNLEAWTDSERIEYTLAYFDSVDGQEEGKDYYREEYIDFSKHVVCRLNSGATPKLAAHFMLEDSPWICHDAVRAFRPRGPAFADTISCSV